MALVLDGGALVGEPDDIGHLAEAAAKPVVVTAV